MRVAVALSGGGRSLANLLSRQAGAGYEVAAVIASRPDCKGVQIAHAAGLPVRTLDFAKAQAAAAAAQIYPWLAEHRIEIVALAGFLKLWPISPEWPGRIVNIHPALLPRFGGPGMYGDRVHAAVLASGAKKSGATVHYVDERYDEGRIIAQVVVPVLSGDTVERLAARVFAAECRLYPEVLTKLASGALPLPDGRVERLRHAGGAEDVR